MMATEMRPGKVMNNSSEFTPPVLIGSSIPAGIEHLKLHMKLKLGDIVLTLIPPTKKEALAVARFCRENKIYLCFSEFTHRGQTRPRRAYGAFSSQPGFRGKTDIDEIVDAAGGYYFARVAMGEHGGVLYWPKSYTINRRVGEWESLPPCETHEEAQAAFIEHCRKWLDYERQVLGKGPLMDVDSSLVFKYHAMAGIDVLCLEMMPGDPHLMHAAIRGAARAFQKPWGSHIAMQCYGGMNFDRLYEKRWRTALSFSYIAGAQFIYPESGHYTYTNIARGQKFGFHSPQTKNIRRSLREMWQFARVHTRPPSGPRVRIGVVHGNLDGSPGLWNRYVWGQYHHEKWLEGPAERGWRFVDLFHRRQDWPKETVTGDMDFSGNPPYGQYDVVPIEAPLEVLARYACLLFLGWNTMTPEIYRKLKAYVSGGGHLLMFLPQLSTHTDRAKEIALYNGGDFSDLFGARVKSKGTPDVRGFKCMALSSLRSYPFPLWRINTDPRFMGRFTPAQLELTTAKVICGHSDSYYVSSEEELRNQAVLIENRLGKGVAFLVAVWEYPADEGVARFTEDLLRVVSAGEQGEIRLLSTDRVRYAVYDGILPASRTKYSVIYLLNTDPDVEATARLWVKGRVTSSFILPAGELRLAYLSRSLLLIPEDKRVDLAAWKVNGIQHEVEFFSVLAQQVEAHNMGRTKLSLLLDGRRSVLPPGEKRVLTLPKRTDPKRRQFFADDFLEEPPTRPKDFDLPY